MEFSFTAGSNKVCPVDYVNDRQQKWQYCRSGSRSAIFLYLSLSQSLGETLVKPSMVENPEHAVEVLTLSVMLPDI